MADKAWKAFERRVAGDWGTIRNPLSGGNSKVTRSDSRHRRLFLECKHGKRSAFWTLWIKTKELAKREKKTPLLCLGNKNHAGYLITCHVDDLPSLMVEFLKARGERELASAIEQKIIPNDR